MEDYLLADFSSHVMAWWLTQARSRGMAGSGDAALGLPAGREHARACCRRRGRPSASAQAAATGARARAIAEVAWGEVARVVAVRNP